MEKELERYCQPPTGFSAAGELRPLASEQIDPVGPQVPPVCPSSGDKNGTRWDETGRSGGTIRCELKALAGNSATCLGLCFRLVAGSIAAASKRNHPPL